MTRQWIALGLLFVGTTSSCTPTVSEQEKSPAKTSKPAAQGTAMAEEAKPQVTLFTNVNVFDGVNETLIRDANVVVTDNIITAVSTEPLAAAGAKIIDGTGGTLIPGLIDAHWHTMYAYLPQAQLLSSNVGFINIAAAEGAGKTLMRGFTTTREAGGGAFGVKQAIDQGMTRQWIAHGLLLEPSGLQNVNGRALYSWSSDHGLSALTLLTDLETPVSGDSG